MSDGYFTPPQELQLKNKVNDWIVSMTPVEYITTAEKRSNAITGALLKFVKNEKIKVTVAIAVVDSLVKTRAKTNILIDDIFTKIKARSRAIESNSLSNSPCNLCDSTGLASLVPVGKPHENVMFRCKCSFSQQLSNKLRYPSFPRNMENWMLRDSRAHFRELGLDYDACLRMKTKDLKTVVKTVTRDINPEPDIQF